ncbi:hypothetical protein LJC16_02150 [Bacteroidales bacterium OttesenSCG-928-C19]|nr:hypothetical protein [Bacteroidales bacterium OttesenSCG-928-C19]
MKKTISVLMLLWALILSLLVGGAISYFTGFPMWLCSCTLFALSFMPKHLPKGAFGMAVQVEIWQKHIEEELFKENTFLQFCRNVQDNIVNGKIVHIPQSGGSGNVVKNRTQLPATVRKRSDTDITYAIDEYTSDPVLIPHADTKELSYDKRQSVLSEDQAKLNQVVAEEVLYVWGRDLPASSIIDTTGDPVPATLAGATGNRRAAIVNDLQSARSVLRNQERWFEGKMYALVPSNLIPQLFPANDQVTATYMASVTEEERRNGVIGKVQGFKILERSSVLRVGEDGTVRAPEDAVVETDSEGILCWYQESVEAPMGQTEFFENIGDPQFYGDVYSFLIRMGSRRSRADNKGVVIIKQGIAA